MSVAGRTWDVVVVGAGPAGAVAARECARRGASVLLVDKATFPRPKVCGCCLNGAAVDTLRRLGLGHVLADAVPLDRVRVAAGARTAALTLPGGVALSREAFDPALIREAVAAGVTFLPETAARLGDERADARDLVLAGVGTVAARVVVAANGLAGRLDGREPAVADGARLGAGVVVPADRVPGFYANGTVFMATAAGGYVGLVRVEGGRLDVAAAFDPAFVRNAGGLGAAAEDVLTSAGWPAVLGLAALPWKGTPTLTRRPAALAARRLFAVGDAAGYVEPFTGEGMAWAVSTAAALAPLAVAAAAGWSDRFARDWCRTHARLVGRRQRACRLVARGLRSPTLTALAVRALGVFPLLSRPVVAALNRPVRLSHGSPA